MKRTALAILVLLLTLLPARAAITRVQTSSGGFSTAATNASTLAVTFTTAPSDSDGKYHYVIVAVCSNTGTGAWGSVDGNYSWSGWSVSGGSTTIVSVLWARVLGTGSTTITVNVSTANGAIAAIAAEYKSDGPLRLDREASGISTTTAVTTGTTSTTSNSNELCVAALGARLTSSSVTGTFTSPTNSYTEVIAGGKSSTNNTSNNDREVDMLEKFLTSTGTTTTGATIPINNSGGVVVTFEEVAVAASTQKSYIYGH